MLITLEKVNSVSRIISGFIDETPDKTGEIFDYTTSKPLFEAWSSDLQKASGGKNFGNLRAMHNKVAAGMLVGIAFDDVAKRMSFEAEVVDDAEWDKVEKGVYTGFSPGGKYMRRWKDGSHTRYTCRPSEMSLVDSPCIPTATFTVLKADGVTEERPFQPACGDDLKKSLYDVSRMTDLIGSLSYLAQNTAAEAGIEQDGSQIPARLRDWLATGVSILTDMAQEEAAEALAGLSALVAKLPASAADLALAAGGDDDLVKRGARNSKADQDKLQAIHDHAVGMGASCAGDAGDNKTGAEKAAGFGINKIGDDLAKMEGDLITARDDLAKLSGERDELKKRVAALEAKPAPGGPVLRTLAKGEDLAEDGQTKADVLAKIDTLPPEEQAVALMKMAHARPSRGFNSP